MQTNLSNVASQPLAVLQDDFDKIDCQINNLNIQAWYTKQPRHRKMIEQEIAGLQITGLAIERELERRRDACADG
jgi:hypothetical protein